MADAESASVDHIDHPAPSYTASETITDSEKIDEIATNGGEDFENTEDNDVHNSVSETPADNELSTHELNDSETQENQMSSQEEQTKEQDEYNAAAAAALADFDAEDDGDGNGDDDDTVNVIIKPTNKGGIYKTGTAYQARSISHLSQHTKITRQGIELDDPGDIHGVPTLEFNLSTLGEEDKPWKRPGADITDYFNYGFTEETWILYCEKQKILRQEYANLTLKPVLGGNTTGLLQRMRTGGANTGIRSYDNLKQSSINVISLSNTALGNRSSGASLLGPKDAVEGQSASINGVTTNNSNILTPFSQPPPGYLTGATQLVEGAGGSAGVTATGVFAVPPPGFSALTGNGSAQLLTAQTATGSGTASGVFPNLNMPPPVLGALSGNWTGSLGVHGLLNAGDALIDPTTGQLTGLLDHSRRSPESVYSNDDHGSRRSRRHYPEDSYFERDAYRSSRKRSRSGSRDRHYSRHHRYHDSRRPDRDYDRRSRHSHRSREGRYSGGAGQDDLMDMDGFCPPTSAILSSRSSERRSDRDRRSERSSDRDRGDHRGTNRRDRERSSRSSRRSRHRSGSRSSHRREFESPSKSPNRFISEDSQTQDGSSATSKPSDPLAIAAAAAANIAAALGATD